MKDQFSAAAVQGTVASQGTYASISEHFKGHFGSPSKLLRRSKGFFFTLCLLTFLCNSTFAQNYDTLNVHDAGFQIIAPNQTMTAGQSATFTISLGDANTPVEGAVAFDIELELDKAEFPSSPNFGLSNSWFFTGGSPDTTHVLDASRNKIRLKGQRVIGITGQGNLFEITLTATASGISAGDMLRQGNGIIMVEDIGFRIALNVPKIKQTAVKLYPNPCRDRLNFGWKGQAPVRITFHNLRGRLMAELQGNAILQKAYSTAHLRRGFYIVTLHFENGEKQVQKLLLN